VINDVAREEGKNLFNLYKNMEIVSNIKKDQPVIECKRQSSLKLFNNK
jgi:hypothetical protein